MTAVDNFRDELLNRIQIYKDAEVKAEARAQDWSREAATMRRRRESAESLFAAEFGDVPATSDEASQAGATETEAKSAATADGQLTGLSWEEALRKVLAEESPLHVRDIWDRMALGGFQTSAKDPLRSIVAVALRTTGVVRSGPNIYGLARGGEPPTAPTR